MAALLSRGRASFFTRAGGRLGGPRCWIYQRDAAVAAGGPTEARHRSVLSLGPSSRRTESEHRKARVGKTGGSEARSSSRDRARGPKTLAVQGLKRVCGPERGRKRICILDALARTHARTMSSVTHTGTHRTGAMQPSLSPTQNPCLFTLRY